MATTISRDPFARTETTRTSVTVQAGEGCAWCGSLNGRSSLFRYTVESDGGRSWPDTHLFCSIGCRRSYYS